MMEEMVRRTQAALCDAFARLDGSGFAEVAWDRPGAVAA
jgi:hypothetical protein